MSTPFEKQLHSLVKLLNAGNIKYAVVGGLAVILYGEPRYTADIDVNISISKGEIEDFLGLAKKYGFSPIPQNVKDFIKKTDMIPMRFVKGKHVGRCDIILAQNKLEYQALARAVTTKINFVKAKVITAEDLILHKITSSRPKDLEDLKGIIAKQKGKLDIKYIKLWLKKLDKLDSKIRLLKLFESLSKEYRL